MQCVVGRDDKLDSVATHKLLVVIGGNSKRLVKKIKELLN
jgi:hypothetical protein